MQVASHGFEAHAPVWQRQRRPRSVQGYRKDKNMGESLHSDENQFSAAQATYCQDEILNCLNILMKVNETTGMETWSDELRQNYRRAVDSLSAIQVYLHLLRAAQQDSGDASSAS